MKRNTQDKTQEKTMGAEDYLRESYESYFEAKSRDEQLRIIESACLDYYEENFLHPFRPPQGWEGAGPEMLALLEDAMLKEKYFPMFKFKRYMVSRFADSLDTNEKKLLYLKTVQAAIARGIWDDDGTGVWIKKVIPAINLQTKFFSPKETTKDVVVRSPRTPKNQTDLTENAQEDSSMKEHDLIQWKGSNVGLMFLFKVLFNYKYIEDDMFTRRVELIMKHFTDKEGKRFKVDSLEQCERNYPLNQEGRPRDGNKLERIVQSLPRPVEATDKSL